MSELINWLHLTDLHLGVDGQSWLWPKFKHELFKDCAKLADQIGGWNLVFFTGDLVQTGSSAEFDLLNKELEILWKELSKTGSEPLFCPVPGNHDLVRPGNVSAISRNLTQLWWQDEDLRKTFWQDPNSEGRRAVEEYFSNYTKWMTQAPVPIIPHTCGILPGDFSAIYHKREVSLGIVGLNSTFLQLADGDFKGKLDLHVSQLNAVCDGDPTAWIKNQTANLLLTHQPPSWLALKAFEHYRQEIYPPGRFLSQLFGHQHEPETLEMSEAGGAPRRYRQGPSVFGLKEWKGVSPIQRIHGYIAGQFVFDKANSIEKFWPRIAIHARHGGLILCPDHSFQLGDDNSVVVELELEFNDGASPDDGSTIQSHKVHDAEASPSDISPGPALQLLDNAPDADTSRSRLSSCPRFPLGVVPQHRAVRQEEQSQFELEIRKTRSVWLVADWGTGKEGFLAAAIERFRDQSSPLEVFHLLCGDADDENSFQALFPQQFGMAMQAFCGYATALPKAFLIFDDVNPALCSGENLRRLQRIASAILDYCPELRVVFISRTPPEKGCAPQVELRPLDGPDVRTYLLNHPDATANLRDADTIEKLHERSDGLPMHLDRMLRALKVSSLESVLDAEMEVPAVQESVEGEVPKALVHAVTSLSQSVDRRSKRSLRLLKVLSVLPYGETLEALNHYLPTEPFFIENALQLNELALLDAIPLKHTAPCVGFGKRGLSEESSPKILKVPRQIGQYVLTLLSDDERAEIVLAGVERFFGRRWRDGKVKLRTMPCEYREYLSTGAGNEFAVVHHLIVDARKFNDTATMRKGAKLGVQYCHRLEQEGRYRDLMVVAGGLLQTIERDDMPVHWGELAALYGEALRMTGKPMEALLHLHGAIKAGEKYFDNDRKASILLDVALAEEKLNHPDTALQAATEIKRLAKPKSAAYLHAVVIEAAVSLEGADKTSRLAALEKQARDQGFPSLADTIALDLANLMETPAEKLQLLDRVLASKEHGYNQTRAVVAKASVVDTVKEGKPDLTKTDLVALSSAYSYLYSQRFGPLFDKCHAALWNLLDSRITYGIFRTFKSGSSPARNGFACNSNHNQERELPWVRRY